MSCVLVPEDEYVEDRQVEWKTQCELHHHHPGEDLVCERVGGFAVVNRGVGRHICLVWHSTAACEQWEVAHWTLVGVGKRNPFPGRRPRVSLPLTQNVLLLLLLWLVRFFLCSPRSAKFNSCLLRGLPWSWYSVRTQLGPGGRDMLWKQTLENTEGETWGNRQRWKKYKHSGKKKNRVKRENTLRPVSVRAHLVLHSEQLWAPQWGRNNDQLEVWFKHREFVPACAIRCLRRSFFAQSVPVFSGGAIETADFGAVAAPNGSSRRGRLENRQVKVVLGPKVKKWNHC